MRTSLLNALNKNGKYGYNQQPSTISKRTVLSCWLYYLLR